jgi:transcription termination factor Rho
MIAPILDDIAKDYAGRHMHLSELKALHVSQLLDMAVANGIEGANRCASRN